MDVSFILILILNFWISSITRKLATASVVSGKKKTSSKKSAKSFTSRLLALVPRTMFRGIWAFVIPLIIFSAIISYALADFTLGTKGSSFNCNEEGNLWCGDDATINSEGYLTLTPDERGKPDEYYTNTHGMALHTVPVQLLDGKGRWRSFSFFFRFKIQMGRSPGDGMAFVIFNASRWMGAAGVSLGVYSNSGHQGLKTLAVEFDTFPNSGIDVFNNHVGVDLETLQSKVSRNAYEVNINLSGGEDVYCWIDYAAESNHLEVRIGLRAERPAEPFLRYGVALSQVFGENGTVFVGFSGSNGNCVCHDFYTIFDWSLKVLPTNHGSNINENCMFIVILGVLATSLLVATVLIISHVLTRKQPVEQGTGYRIGYEELSLGTGDEDAKL